MHVSSEGHTAQSCGRSLLYDQSISSQILTSFSFQITIKKKDKMPQKQKSKSWAELKQAGNECFKTGQYGDANNLYSQAIKELEKSSECYLNITCRYLILQRTVRNNEHKHNHVCLHLKQPDSHTVCKTFNHFNTYQGSVSITVACLFHKMSSTSVIWSTDVTVNSLCTFW